MSHQISSFVDDYAPYTKGQLNRLGQYRASDYLRENVINNSDKHWDAFYKKNGDKFFKNRHWITREFPELRDSDPKLEKRLMEVGCVFPLLETSHPNLRVIAFDLSPHAVEIIKSHHIYATNQINAFAYDITNPEDLDVPGVSPGSMDFITLIFVLSAIPPSKIESAMRKVIRALKPGGVIFFRDYARGDLAQKQMSERDGYKTIQDNLYMRGDFTMTYYFSKEEVINMMGPLTCIECGHHEKQVINHKEDKNMNRVFVQGRFIK
ncbi:methyltransferase-like protein [Acrasis kona]|uniref:tRNA N(3)-methylcytidine methyltransferase n=1 Tax=Acrasis kona TaxID=1008807 RepID=A0AAW2YW31_9EUKA